MRLTWTVIYMHLIAWCMRLTTRVYGVFISICYFTTCMHATFIVQLLTLGACARVTVLALSFVRSFIRSFVLPPRMQRPSLTSETRSRVWTGLARQFARLDFAKCFRSRVIGSPIWPLHSWLPNTLRFPKLQESLGTRRSPHPELKGLLWGNIK